VGATNGFSRTYAGSIVTKVMASLWMTHQRQEVGKQFTL
jgi:hypothetical protein